jgi:hypothetical protein
MLANGGGFVKKVSASKFVVYAPAVTTSYPAVQCGTVSGTTITMGTRVDLAATAVAASAYPFAVIGSDKFLAPYLLSGSASTLRAKACTISTRTITAGSEQTHSMNALVSSSHAVSGACGGTDNGVIGYYGVGAGSLNFTYFVGFTVSGTTITFGTEQKHLHAAGTYVFSTIGRTSNSAYFSIANGIHARMTLSAANVTMAGNRPVNLSYTGASSSFAVPVSAPGYFVCMLSQGSAPKEDVGTVMMITPNGYVASNPLMAFSFDGGTTYRIWNVSTYRDIASSLNSVHGGTNGVWYYRNAASTWTAASTNSAIGALKQATVFPENTNCICDATGMSGANWTTLGFTESPTGTMKIAYIWNSKETPYSGGVPEYMDQVTFSYTQRSTWKQNSTSDYTIDAGNENYIKFTKNSVGTASVKMLVLGETQ